MPSEHSDERSIIAVLRQAARRVQERPRLLLSLWAASLVVSLGASLPVYSALRLSLGRRPLGAALAAGQADAVWSELLTDHPTLGPAALVGLSAGAAVYWLLCTLLSGGLVDALRPPEDPRRVVGTAVLTRAVATWGPMLRITLWGALLRVPALLVLLAAAAVLDRHAGGWSYQRNSLITGAALLLGALLWAAAGVVVNYGRVYLLRLLRREGTPQVHLGALRALRQGLCRSVRSGRDAGATLLLGACSVLGLGLVVALGHVGAGKLDGGPAALGFLWRQVCAIIEIAVGLFALAGAVGVVDTQQVGPSGDPKVTDF